MDIGGGWTEAAHTYCDPIHVGQIMHRPLFLLQHYDDLIIDS